MSGRRATGLVAALLIVAAGLVWRSAFGRDSEADRVVVRTLATLARDTTQPIALLTETEDVDRMVRAALRDSASPAVTIIPRDPAAIDAAVGAGTLLAGQRGRQYLEVLGYELEWLPQNPQSPSFPWSRVHARLRCAPVKADAWSPLPGLEYTGRLGVVLPAAAGGALLLIVGDDLPLDVDVSALDGTHARVRREVFPSIAAAPPDYWIEQGTPRDAPGHVQQLTLLASPGRDRVLSVHLGRRAPRVLARLRGFAGDARATICAAPTGAETAFRNEATSVVVLPDFDAHFGTGWSDVIVEPRAGPVRWMGRHGALLIPFARRGDMEVVLRAYRADEAGDGQMSLRINGTFDTPALPLGRGIQRYEWKVPEAAWVTGTNELWLRVSGEGDQRLLAVTRLELALAR